MTNVPQAPALPDNAPVIFEMYDWKNPAAPILTSSVTLDVVGPEFVLEDAVYAAERGAASWHRSDHVLTLGDFEFGAHLFVSQAANTTSGTQALQEVLIGCVKRGDWKDFPSALTYDKKAHSVFPPAFKIVAKDKAGNVVHTFEMHDGLAINDPTLHQGYPTTTAADRPKFSVGGFLPWWNERPRQSASIANMFAGITQDSMRPSASKSHFSVLSCEPQITGGYSRNSLNSLASIWQSLQWAQPKAMYWPPAEEADPYCNYTDTNFEGKSAQMGPWIEGWGYEPGSRTSHNWYTAPGGPRFDRSSFPSQIALWVTEPSGYRIQNKVAYADIAYNYALAYANHPNHWLTDPAKLYWCADEDLLLPKKNYHGQYYGDAGPITADSILLNANQRDGTDASHYDNYGDMPLNGWGRDSLHDYATAAHAAIAMQSPMMAIISKWDTATAFMLHGDANQSGVYGSYLVRDMAWNWLHHALAWKLAADHPLGFNRKSIEDRFAGILESINRDIAAPMAAGDHPGNPYFEGIARFGQPLTEDGGSKGMHGGGLAFYIGGALMYMKQSGMWEALQQRGGAVKAGLNFTVRNCCQYAFGIFSQTKATMFSNPAYSVDAVFADNSNIPKDWAELSAYKETDGSDFNSDPNGTVVTDRDVSIHPVIQFVYIMRDYFPEIEHPWKEAAIAKVDMYLKRQTDKVASLIGHPDQQRDADHIFRYPGLGILKAPLAIGPSPAVTLPEVKVSDTSVKPEAPFPGTEDGTWSLIGGEGSNCSVPPASIVKYGLGTKWKTRLASGSFYASNDFFGGDPSPGASKQVMLFTPSTALATPVITPPVATYPTAPVKSTSVWVKIGNEGDVVTVSDNTTVRYGANGQFNTKVFSGVVGLNNGVFGDPVTGITKYAERLVEAPAAVVEPVPVVPVEVPPVKAPEPVVPPVELTPTPTTEVHATDPAPVLQVPVKEEPATPVATPVAIVVASAEGAMVAGCKAFLEAMGYTVTKA
jgi:hypothetical protein